MFKHVGVDILCDCYRESSIRVQVIVCHVTGILVASTPRENSCAILCPSLALCYSPTLQDLDYQAICWKGGSILSVLDTIGDQWIFQDEWLKYRSKIVREKVPFAW